MKKLATIVAAAMLMSTAANAEICKSEADFAKAVLSQWEQAWQKTRRVYPLGKFTYSEKCKRSRMKNERHFCGNNNWISTLISKKILKIEKTSDDAKMFNTAPSIKYELQPGVAFKKWTDFLRLTDNRIVWEPRYTFSLEKVLKSENATFKGVAAKVVSFSYYAMGDKLQEHLHNLHSHRKARILVYCDDSAAQVVNVGGEFGNYADAGYRDSYGEKVSDYVSLQ